MLQSSVTEYVLVITSGHVLLSETSETKATIGVEQLSAPIVAFVSDVSDNNTCPEVITRTYSVTDDCNNSINVTQTITVDDTTAPTFLFCPNTESIPADWEESFATVSLDDPTYTDNCTPVGSLTLTWTMSGATVANGVGIIPDPYQFNVGPTTITYTITDNCGNSDNCQFVITITEESDIECQPAIDTVSDFGSCFASLDPGQPTLLAGAGTITWTWSMTDESGTIIDSGNGQQVSPLPYSFPVGITYLTWRAENAAGYDECIQIITVTDDQQPTFTAPAPLEECVESIFEAIYYAPTMDIAPDRPEYYIFTSGNTALDLDPTNYTDNCDLSCTVEIRWRIDFENGTALPSPTPSTYNTGQPSTYGSDIQFLGDGVTFNNVVHTITYWIVDCHGNVSAPQTTTMTVTPRPEIIKLN